MARVKSGETQKTKVFISYSRRESAFIERLAAGLQALGITTLLDNHDIEAFEDWWNRVRKLIESADTIVAVISPNFVTSEICAKEIEFAASLSKRFAPVVRVRVPDNQIPTQLAKLNYFFAEEDADFDATLKQLYSALTSDLPWIRRHTEFGERARQWDARNRPRALLFPRPLLREAIAWLKNKPPSVPPPDALILSLIAASKRARRIRRAVVAVAALAIVAIVVLNDVALQSIAIVNAVADDVAKLTPEAMSNLKQANSVRRTNILMAASALSLKREEVEALYKAQGTLCFGSPELPSGPRCLLRQFGLPENLPEAESLPSERIFGVESAASLKSGSAIALMSNGRAWQFDARGKTEMGWLNVPFNSRPIVKFIASDPAQDAFVLRAGGALEYFNRDPASNKSTTLELAGAGLFEPRNGGIVAVPRTDRKIALWRPARDAGPVILEGNSDFLITAEFTTDGKYLLTTSMDGIAKVWDTETGKAAYTLGEQSPLASSSFSHDGTLIVSTTRAGALTLWDRETGAKVREKQVWDAQPQAADPANPDPTRMFRMATFAEGGERILAMRGDLRFIVFDKNLDELSSFRPAIFDRNPGTQMTQPWISSDASTIVLLFPNFAEVWHLGEDGQWKSRTIVAALSFNSRMFVDDGKDELVIVDPAFADMHFSLKEDPFADAVGLKSRICKGHEDELVLPEAMRSRYAWAFGGMPPKICTWEDLETRIGIKQRLARWTYLLSGFDAYRPK